MNMEKVLNFTDKQKELIWERFVSPAGGTLHEAEHFIEVCETFGLNPLLNDIVFQRFNTKYGPKTQFITTRDGLLRVATHQPGYVGAPNANVVKEGDEFQFDPSKGEVHHKFGQKRGKIIGAYAVMKHAKFNPVAVFVDFEEYFNANSGKLNNKNGYPNIWDKMPSAMIVKIAEVFVLRRQFPLGGLYTTEEMALEETKPTETDPVESVQQKETVKQVAKLSQEQVSSLEKIVQEISKTADVPSENIIGALGKPLTEFRPEQYTIVKEKLKEWLLKAKEQTPQNTTNDVKENKENNVASNDVQENVKQNEALEVLTLIKKETGTSPNGSRFVRVQVKEVNEPIFARDNKVIESILAININDTFTAKIDNYNGFLVFDHIEDVLAAV